MLEQAVSHFISREAHSTESFQISWLRVVTSPPEMALVESPSTAQILPMRISPTSTQDVAFFPWQMLAQVLTAPNSSFASPRLLISTVRTSYLERCQMVWTSSKRWKPIPSIEMTSLKSLLSSPIVDSWHDNDLSTYRTTYENDFRVKTSSKLANTLNFLPLRIFIFYSSYITKICHFSRRF